MLRAYLARNETERVQQMLGNFPAYEMPAPLQAEWIELSAALLADLEKLRAAAEEKWQDAVDKLLVEVREKCPAAESAAALEPLLVRCAALQMQRFGERDVVNQRAGRKLAGIVETLQAWTTYLDYRAAGNAQAANGPLRNLASGGSQFPVLNVAEIQAHMLPVEPTDALGLGAVKEILAGVSKLEDLEGAIARVNALPRRRTPVRAPP